MRCGSLIETIEEGRAASKSPHQKFGYFLSMSQQAVYADIITNSAVGIIFPKTEGTKTYAARVYWLVVYHTNLEA
jgi:hypothetical protein